MLLALVEFITGEGPPPLRWAIVHTACVVRLRQEGYFRALAFFDCGKE